MKKTIALSLLTFFSLMINAQYFTGFGPFKVGVSKISIIDSLKDNGFRFNKSRDVLDYFTLSGKTIMINPIDESADYKLTGIGSFTIGEIEISGVLIKKLELHFFEGLLYKIMVNEVSKDVLDAIEIKYGKPRLELKTKKIKCSSRLIGEFEEEEETFYSYYPSPDHVKSYSVISKYYDSKCKKQLLSFLNISDSKISEKVISLNSQKYQEKKEKESQDKLKQLKDF